MNPEVQEIRIEIPPPAPTQSSQDYLDAMDQLKQKFDYYEKKNLLVVGKYKETAKETMELYGLICAMDHILVMIDDVPPEFHMLFELTKSRIDDIVDNFISG